jgi:DNA invertase Pin-like site-specific DNA recombinase
MTIEQHLVLREKALRELARRLGYRVWRVIVENDINPKTGKPRPASAFKRRKVALPDGTYALRVIRPRFREILDHLAAGRANALLTEDLDRCVRDPRDLEDLIDVCQARGVNARSLAASLTFTSGGTDSEITQARIMVAVANKSSRDTARRVSAERERQALEGRFGGGPRPFGFEKDGITKVEEECAVVAEMSTRLIQLDAKTGENVNSLRLLTRELRERGIKTVNGNPWTTQALREILLRPRNAAFMVWQGDEVGTAPWEEIVDEDVFRAVQRLLQNPDRVTTRTGAGAGAVWLGSGLYRCGVCGDGTKLYVHNPKYNCSGTLYGGKSHMSRNRVALDRFVESSLWLYVAEGGANKFVSVGTNKPKVNVKKLQAERAALRVKLDGLAEDHMADRITRSQLQKGTAHGRARIEQIDGILAESLVDSPVLPLVEAATRRKNVVANVAKVWDAQPIANQRAIIRELLTVTVHGTTRRGPGLDTNAIQIDWNDAKAHAA